MSDVAGFYRNFVENTNGNYVYGCPESGNNITIFHVNGGWKWARRARYSKKLFIDPFDAFDDLVKRKMMKAEDMPIDYSINEDEYALA